MPWIYKDTKEDMAKFENQDKFIRPWEALHFKRNKFILKYDKTQFDLFHILDYSKTMKIVSVGFLYDDLQRYIIETKLDEVPKIDDQYE